MTTLNLSHPQKIADEQTQPMKQVGANRWTVIIGALIVQIILGTVYAFSVFVRPLEQEFGWSRATTQWAFSFALASFAICMIPAGRLQDKIGPRKVASIGGMLLGLSFILGALLVKREPSVGALPDLRHCRRSGHWFCLCLPYRRSGQMVP